MSQDLTVRTNPVPANFCFTGFNGNWLDIVTLLYVRLPEDVTPFNFGSTTPAPDRRDRPWFRTNADGTPDAIYAYALGVWLSKHTVAPGTVIMYEGTKASIETFDGGEAGAVTNIGGPFWEKVDEIDARVPIGPGTLESGTVVAVGDVGGEGRHTLTEAEMPSHTHTYNRLIQGGDANNGGSNGVNPISSVTGATGGGLPHNNYQPFYSLLFLRRTARLYRRI